MKPNYHLIIFLVFIVLVSTLNYLVELNAYTPPIANTISSDSMTVMQQPTPSFEVIDYPITPITLEERCVDEDYQKVTCHQLQNIQTGDVLITKSTHSLLYRHGHAGVVVDAEAGLVLESLGYGTSSRLESLDKWNYYPAVKVLRLKDKNNELINELVHQATTYYLDIPYNLIATKNSLKMTHCSDIVWKVFQSIGIDLDSDGGKIVTPYDISQSPYLYEVESYGFSKSRPW